MDKSLENGIDEMFGIHILSFDDYDVCEAGMVQYNNVVFEFESMKQYDGSYVERSLEGNIVIWSATGEQLWEGKAVDIPEFREKLLEQMKK